MKKAISIPVVLKYDSISINLLVKGLWNKDKIIKAKVIHGGQCLVNKSFKDLVNEAVKQAENKYKKIITLSIFLLSLFFISCSNIYIEKEPDTFYCDSKIREWIKDNITYKADLNNFKLDDWQSPQETIRKGTGDCEDFAILWMYFMKRDFNIETEMILGVHKDIMRNHYWAESLDKIAIYHKNDDTYLFTKVFPYRDVILTSYK